MFFTFLLFLLVINPIQSSSNVCSETDFNKYQNSVYKRAIQQIEFIKNTIESYRRVVFESSIVDGFVGVKDTFEVINDDYTTNCSDYGYYLTLITKESQSLEFKKNTMNEISDLFYIPASDLLQYLPIRQNYVEYVSLCIGNEDLFYIESYPIKFSLEEYLNLLHQNNDSIFDMLKVNNSYETEAIYNNNNNYYEKTVIFSYNGEDNNNNNNKYNLSFAVNLNLRKFFENVIKDEDDNVKTFALDLGGRILNSSNRTLLFLFNDVIPDPPYMLNSSRYFNLIFSCVQQEKEGCVIEDDEKISFNIRYELVITNIYIISIVPSLIFSGGQIITSTSIIPFKFSTSEEYSYSSFYIINTADYNIYWEQDKTSSYGLLTEYESGIVYNHSEQLINVKLDVQKQLNETNHVFYMSIVPDSDYEGCFVSLFLTSNYTIEDCGPKDYTASLSCNGFKGYIYYNFINATDCHDGLLNIPPTEIKCPTIRNIKGSPIIAHLVITSLSVLYIIFYMFLFSFYREKTRQIFPLSLLYLFSTGQLISVVSGYFAYLSVENHVCIIHNFLLTYGFLLQAVSFYNIVDELTSIYVKKRVSQNYTFRSIFISIMIPTLLHILVSIIIEPYHYTHKYEFYDIKLEIELCGYHTRSVLMDLLYFLTPALYSLFGTVLFVQLVQATWKSLSFPMKRALITLQIYAVFYLCVVLYRGFTTSTGNGSSIYALILVASIIPIIIFTIIFPFNFYFKDEKSFHKTLYSKSILTDPIARSCLKLFLTAQNLQQELYFWEDATNYRQTFESLLEGERCNARDQIISLYIDGSKGIQVTCPDAIREAIIERAGRGVAELTIFDDEINYIEGVVLKNQEPGFLNSIFGTKALVLQKWYEIFDTFDYDIQLGIFEKVIMCIRDRSVQNAIKAAPNHFVLSMDIDGSVLCDSQIISQSNHTLPKSKSKSSNNAQSNSNLIHNKESPQNVHLTNVSEENSVSV